MFAEEWALMMFTLLSQLAIGTFIILTAVQTMLAQKAGEKTALELTRFGFLAVGPVMALALIFSLFHLGSPAIAFRAISNLGSSWLSREILFAILFLVLWFAAYSTLRKGKTVNILGWITSVAGVVTVYSMAGIYAASVRPAWANVNTYFAFFGTMLLFGVLGTTAAVVFSRKGATLNVETIDVLQKTSWVAFIGIAVQLIYLPVFLTGLASGGTAAQASAGLMAGAYAFPEVLRWALSIAGGILLVYAFAKQRKSGQALPANLVYLGLSAVLVGEFIGRYIFYATAVSIMVG